MENISLFASAIMFAIFFIDLLIKRSWSLTFALLSNPYVAGLIMYFTMFIDSFINKNRKFYLSKATLLCYTIILCTILASYFSKSITLRTAIQLTQFCLILLGVCFVIFSQSNYLSNASDKIKYLLMSCVLITTIKLCAVILGIDQFSMNGQNEDSFLIVIFGFILGFVYFERVNAKSTAFYAFIFLGLILYESRAAQAVAFMSLFGFLIAAMSKFKLARLIIFFAFCFLLLIIVISNVESLQFFLQTTTDLERNHSNIERVSMYLFTFKYLISGADSFGLGNLGLAMEEMRIAGIISGDYPHPHSSYLRFALELGWGGLLGLVFFYVALISKSLKIYKKAPKIGIVLFIATTSLIIFSFVDCIFFSFFRASASILAIALIIAAASPNLRLSQSQNLKI